MRTQIRPTQLQCQGDEKEATKVNHQIFHYLRPEKMALKQVFSNSITKYFTLMSTLPLIKHSSSVFFFFIDNTRKRIRDAIASSLADSDCTKLTNFSRRTIRQQSNI